MIENQLRRMMAAKAAEFVSPVPFTERSLRRSRLRRARHAVGAATAVAVAVLAAVLVTNEGTPSAAAFAEFRLDAKAVGKNDGRRAHGHDATGSAITPEKLRRHAACMRGHGINVADPVQTRDGWMIPVKDPPVDLDSSAGRRAFFVDCRLIDVSDNLVLGGRTRAEIEKLIACTRTHGFELPQPTQEGTGQFVFNLAKATPRWGSDAWYEALFVTCAPARAITY